MRIAILLAGTLSLVAGCGDNMASTGDAGGPDVRVPPAACADPEPGIICTIAGSGGFGYSGDDGPALEAEFSLPQDTVADPDGGLFILDWNNHRVRKLVTEGDESTVIHIAGRGELGGDLDDPANQDFNHPTNLLRDPDTGEYLIAAWHNSKIRTLDTEDGTVTDRCGDGRRAYFGDEMAAMTASFDLPAAIAWSPDGELWVMDQANQVIRRVDSEGIVHKVAGNCIIDAPPPNGPGACETPVACAPPSGKWTCGDPMSTCGAACNPGYAGGTAATLRMAQPFGQSADPAGRIAFDAEGNLLWVDTENSLIRKLDSEGNDTIVAGLPPVDGVQQKGYSGDGGPADEAKLNRPVDIAIDEDGTIYFTDVFNDCVRAIDPDGTITTAVGVCGERDYDGDGGLATEAHLKLAYGIELSGDTLYIADTGNSVIRAVKLR
jgi:sugar lactone lactonase YvrE